MPPKLSNLPPNSLRTIARYLSLWNIGHLSVTSKNMATALHPELKKVWKKEVESVAREYLHGLEDVMKIYRAYNNWRYHHVRDDERTSSIPFTFPTQLQSVVSNDIAKPWALRYTLNLKHGFLRVTHNIESRRWKRNTPRLITVSFYGRSDEKHFDMTYELNLIMMPPATWKLSIARETPHFPSLFQLGIVLFMLHAAPKTLKFNTGQIDKELERQFTPEELLVWRTKVNASLGI